MRVVIPCGGTRGDTQPMVALGVALRKLGHEVKYLAPTTHVKLCRDQKFDCVEFELDIDHVLEELLENSNRKGFGTGLSFMRKCAQIANQPHVKEKAKEFLPRFWKIANEFRPHVIIMARPFPISMICEKLRIPFVLVTYQLLGPSRESPPAIINDGMPFQWIPSPSFWHKWVGQTLVPLLLKKSLNSLFDVWSFEKENLGVNPKKDRKLVSKHRTLSAHVYQWAPQLIAVDPELLPPPSDYGLHQHFAGFWFLDENTDNFTPTVELEEFLSSSSAPVVYVGFGSMRGNESMSTELTRIVLRAIRSAGLRGLLLGGWAKLSRHRLNNDNEEDVELKAWASVNVWELAAVPHSWLFPRVAAVCHHGGAGTMAAGLRAGKPTVVVPFFADQPYWANVVEKSGVGRKAPHVSKLTVEVLAPLLKDVTENKGIRVKAQALGESMKKREWAGDAIEYIERFMNTFPYPWKVNCQEDQSEEASYQRRMIWNYESPLRNQNYEMSVPGLWISLLILFLAFSVHFVYVMHGTALRN